MKSLRIVILSIFPAADPSCKQAKNTAPAQKMGVFVDDLIKKITLIERSVRSLCFTSDWSMTGPSMRNDYRPYETGEGQICFNTFTVDFVRELQPVAVQETRLHVPLIFDGIIHGHRTIFPIPLGPGIHLGYCNNTKSRTYPGHASNRRRPEAVYALSLMLPTIRDGDVLWKEAGRIPFSAA